MNPRYPVYIISKGRHETRLTSRTLEYMNVPYHIVVEPQEFDDYASVIDSRKILTLPFSNLGQGSIPARNWVWEHAITTGAKRHWLMDDNIQYFFRFNHNLKVPVSDGTIFRCMEDFTDRYKDVAFSGPNYFMFASRKSGSIRPFTLNTRVYSCTLINNSYPERWRGKYNEDTDICLRALKSNWRTILFNAFLCGKAQTMTMKGGNTDEVYIDGDNRMKFAKSLKDQHPDCVEITKKFGRWHHHVDYSSFKRNRLEKLPCVKHKRGVDNYGMTLVVLTEQQQQQHKDKMKKTTRRLLGVPEFGDVGGNYFGISLYLSQEFFPDTRAGREGIFYADNRIVGFSRKKQNDLRQQLFDAASSHGFSLKEAESEWRDIVIEGTKVATDIFLNLNRGKTPLDPLTPANSEGLIKPAFRAAMEKAAGLVHSRKDDKESWENVSNQDEFCFGDDRMIIYILRSNPTSSLYKIGKTTNLDRRLKEYSTHNPEFVVIGYYDERKGLSERLIHDYFSAKRSKLEFFDLTPQDIELVKSPTRMREAISASLKGLSRGCNKA